MSFIRFVVGVDSDSPRVQNGLFTEIEQLRQKGMLEPYQITMVIKTFEFFNTNLPVPPYSSKTWSIDAISWFKDSAKEFIDKMWDLAAILEEHGYSVRVLTIKKPGMILYEDDFQIVAQNRTH